MTKAAGWILALTLTHLAVVLGCFALSAGPAMSRLDSGAPGTAGTRTASAILDVLLQPLACAALGVLGRAGASGAWSYVAILANSAIWGVGLYCIWRVLHRNPVASESLAQTKEARR